MADGKKPVGAGGAAASWGAAGDAKSGEDGCSNSSNGFPPPPGLAEALPLSAVYPVNATVELTLSPKREVVKGVVYCTDDVSNVVVLRLAREKMEIFVVNAASVLDRKLLTVPTAADPDKDEGAQALAEGADSAADSELYLPLPHVSKKALEERERRAMRIAEETFGHVNQEASPEGHHIFDKLLKACNEVVWTGTSVLVLNHIRVDPPYTADNCVIVQLIPGGLNEGSLDRVKRIVSQR